MTTYTLLRADILAYSGNAAVTSHMDGFIAKTEAEFNRRLRIKSMETTDVGTFTTNSNAIAVPSGFLEARTFTYAPDAQTVRDLKFKTPQQIAALELVNSGRPSYYTFANGEISFERPSDAAYSYSLLYYARVPGLTGSNASNEISINHEDAYLTGCLYWAYLFLQDPEKASLLRGLFDRHIEDIKRADARERFKAAEVAFDTPGVAQTGSILEG